jgi:hypothetical protein
MDQPQAMALRLESYLMQLSDVNRRLSGWLDRTQSAALKNQPDQLMGLQQEADTLMKDVREIVTSRQQILSSAQQAGWRVTSLGALARQLPIWKRPRFRAAFESAKQQLQQLRRLHVATWLLLGQSANYCHEVTTLLMSGTTKTDVYFANGPRETGGQLLDAQL